MTPPHLTPLLLVLSTCFLWACKPPPPKKLTFEGIALTHPGGWSVETSKEQGQITVHLAPPLGNASLIVMVHSDFSSDDLAAAAKHMGTLAGHKEVVADFSDGVVEEQSDSASRPQILGVEPSRLRVAGAVRDGFVSQIKVVDDGTSIVVRLSTYAFPVRGRLVVLVTAGTKVLSREDDLKEMATSLRFTWPQPEAKVPGVPASKASPAAKLEGSTIQKAPVPGTGSEAGPVKGAPGVVPDKEVK